MNSELYFFKYSFPCAQVLLDQKKIDNNAYEKLKEMFFSNKAPSKRVLEEVFSSAFRRINIVAKQMNKDAWDLGIIKKYFIEEHNKFIDRGEGEYAHFGKNFKQVCKVYIAEVIDKKEDILTVKYNNTIRKVLGNIVPKAKKGDKVTIHLGFAIEIL